MAGNRWIAISTGKERMVRVGCGYTLRKIHLNGERWFVHKKPSNINIKKNKQNVSIIKNWNN